MKVKGQYSFLLLFACLQMTAWCQTDCKPYIPVKEGSTWEISNFNAKGKLQGRIVYELEKKSVSGADIIFTVNTTTFDKKDEEIYSSSFDATCSNGQFDLGMEFKMDGNALQAYQNMEVEVDASSYEIPDLSQAVGTTLPDGSLTVAVQGPIPINMKVNITDRIIEAKEQITTPAGSFDCIVLSQTVSTKTVLNVMATSKEWYAENIGMVRSESYNKKGKLLGYSELTKMN